ncbi:hypothetical protein A0256_20830 [Mucilaginibacter sp. PAMC 26640]|nr:hypothetical protein A0256_20830 [Mucilaginibacter sp. PAMC 26640]
MKRKDNHQLTFVELGDVCGYDDNYPMAQYKNAARQAIASTSFEDDYALLTYKTGNIVIKNARTGVKCSTGSLLKSTFPADSCLISLWAKGTGNITIGGVRKTISTSWTKMYGL